MPDTMRYLVEIDGQWRHTAYTPAQTALVQQLLREGLSLDAVWHQTGIPYSSLRYVAAMRHVSRVLTPPEQPHA